ncbi:MAG: hypothetical protein JWO38_3560 [Gemmataceae bacterium]|nr:hypothetical protein [Gemmataceae bacterium]
MFVPVACLKCGKMFQVPEAAAGTDVTCPWCKATTPALPVAGVTTSASPAPAAAPLAVPPVPEPLSLDDAPPADAPRTPTRTGVERAPTPPAARPPFRFSFKTALAVLVLVVVVSAATVAVLGYGSGRIAPSAWAEFTPPDGSCTVALPGPPVAERVEPNAADGVTRGGERFVTTGWYSRATVWVGWQDLDPGWAKQAAADRDGALTTPVLAAERDRRKEKTGGTVPKEGNVRFGSYTGLVAQMDTPRGRLVEWFILALDGPHPRLYFLGIEAKNVSPDSPAAQKLFNSFRVNKE